MAKDVADVSGRLAIPRYPARAFDCTWTGIVGCDSEVNHAEPVEHLPQIPRRAEDIGHGVKAIDDAEFLCRCWHQLANGSSYLMAPFTHVSTDRPSRFTDGSYGVLYVGDRFETALFETIHHHARFMARTKEAPGWTSQYREIIMSVDADLHDLRSAAAEPAPMLDTDSYAASQALAANLRGAESDGIVYPSIRHPGGECVALFYPDCASNPLQGRHLDYHWDGQRVDLVPDAGSGAIFRIVDLPIDPV